MRNRAAAGQIDAKWMRTRGLLDHVDAELEPTLVEGCELGPLERHPAWHGASLIASLGKRRSGEGKERMRCLANLNPGTVKAPNGNLRVENQAIQSICRQSNRLAQGSFGLAAKRQMG